MTVKPGYSIFDKTLYCIIVNKISAPKRSHTHSLVTLVAHLYTKYTHIYILYIIMLINMRIINVYTNIKRAY